MISVLTLLIIAGFLIFLDYLSEIYDIPKDDGYNPFEGGEDIN